MNATQLLSADSPPVRPRAARRREPGLGSPPYVLRPLSSTVYPRPFALHLFSSALCPAPSVVGPRRPSSGAEPSGPPPSVVRGRALRDLRLPGSSPRDPPPSGPERADIAPSRWAEAAPCESIGP